MAKIVTTRLMFVEYAHAKKFVDTYSSAAGTYDYWVTPVIVNEYNWAVGVRGTADGVHKIEADYIEFMQQGRGKACIM